MLSASAEFTWNKKVEQAIKNAAKRVTVEVGIPEEAKYPNGKSVNEVAMTMEFGNGKTPPRPFARQAIASDKADWKESIGKKLNKVAHGKTGSARMALKALGNEVRESIVRSIERLVNPALAPSTIATKKAKGSKRPEKPLIDTGTLKNSFKVVELEGEE